MIDNPYYKVPADAFNSMQMDTGVLLTEFDFAEPYDEPADEVILAVTSGGINPVCKPRYTDLAEDVDNVPNNTKEFLRVDGYDCSMSFKSLRFNPDNVAWSIGGATVYDQTADLPKDAVAGTKKIVPKIQLDPTDDTGDFRDIYGAFPLSDGGIFVVRLKNAISSDGLNIQTTKDGKGTNQVTLTGYISVSDVKDVPMEFYVIPKQTTQSSNTQTTPSGNG